MPWSLRYSVEIMPAVLRCSPFVQKWCKFNRMPLANAIVLFVVRVKQQAVIVLNYIWCLILENYCTTWWHTPGMWLRKICYSDFSHDSSSFFYRCELKCVIVMAESNSLGTKFCRSERKVTEPISWTLFDCQKSSLKSEKHKCSKYPPYLS